MKLYIVVWLSLQSIYNLPASISEEPISGRLFMRGDSEEREEEEERGGEENRTEERDELDNVREEEEEVCKVERLRHYE